MTDRAIEVDRLTRRFGSFVAVDSVSFDVERGEIFGYLGANGAGKSTTIRMLCGILAPTEGTARIAGVDVVDDPEGVKRALGYMSQRFSLYRDLRVEENLEFFGSVYGLSARELRKRIPHVLEEVGMLDAHATLAGALPGGLRQRIALASALLHDPPILFLDEPTAGVDPDARRTFWKLIQDLSAAGRTVFVTTHYMDEAEYCDRIGLMVDGRLVALDTPARLKAEQVEGHMVRVEGSAAASAMDFVRRLSGVFEVQPFGLQLHVRYDPNHTDEARLESELAKGGFTLQVVRIDPTLEDVFLAVVRSRGAVS